MVRRTGANHVELTDDLVSSLVAPHDRFRVWDTVVPALSVRVTLRGTKSFYVTKHPRLAQRSAAAKRAHKDDRLLVNRFIATFPEMNVEEARDEARRIVEAIDNGFVPRPKRRASRLRREQIITLVTSYLVNQFDSQVKLPDALEIDKTYKRVTAGPVPDHLIARAVRELGLLD